MRFPRSIPPQISKSAARHPEPRDVATWELALLPISMAGLSLAMWLSLPSFESALESMRPRIEEKRGLIARMAADAGSGDVVRNGCSADLVPPLAFVEDDANASNAEPIYAGRLSELGIESQLPDEFDLGLSGQLSFVLYWSLYPPITSQRMVRERIARQFEAPLAQPYVVLYGTRVIGRGADGEPAAVAVSAFVFDGNSGRRLCEFAFMEPSHDAGRLDRSTLWSNARLRFMQALAEVTGQHR